MKTPTKILEIVSQICDVSVSDIVGSSRIHNIVEARQLFCLAVKENNKISDKSIGNYIQKKSCTVWKANYNIRELIKIYPHIRKLYNDINYEISME